MSSILTFSNKSVKLFTLKNRFLITAEVEEMKEAVTKVIDTLT